MAAGKVLRVLARGSATVADHAHFEGVKHDGHVRYVGRTWDPSKGDQKTTSGGRVLSKDPTVISQNDHPLAFTEYLLAIRSGDLWAADEETARMAGVQFDPKFGGEFSSVKDDDAVKKGGK